MVSGVGLDALLHVAMPRFEKHDPGANENNRGAAHAEVGGVESVTFGLQARAGWQADSTMNWLIEHTLEGERTSRIASLSIQDS